jgi:hypothetical protein
METCRVSLFETGLFMLTPLARGADRREADAALSRAPRDAPRDVRDRWQPEAHED